MGMKEKRGTLLRLGALAALAGFFLALYSSATSPLTDFHGYDSAFFMLVGQGMTKGMLPYRDFFDMKGPYLFFLEYLGQLICYGRTGVFLVQWVNLTLSLWIADCIFRKMLGRSNFLREMAMIIPCFAVAAVTFEGGNLTEEYSLPWLLLAVYFALDYLTKSQASGAWRHPAGIGFYYGAAFGVLALIRVTNAAMIGAIILTISVGLVVKGEWKNLLANGGAFILGCGAAFAPMCVFYACHGLLSEMFSQVFLFGVRYAAEVSLSEKIALFLAGFKRCVLWTALPIGVLAVYGVRSWRYWLLSLSAFALLLAATLMGNAYLHYFTLGIPNLVLGLAFLAGEGRKVPPKSLRRAAAVGLTVVILAAQWPLFWSSTQKSVGHVQSGLAGGTDGAVTEIKSHIPEADWDSVYVYGLSSCSNWYTQAGLLPCHRYCDWQAHYIELNPAIGTELTAFLAAETPQWVVIPSDGDVQPSEIADVLLAHYHETARNSAYILLSANAAAEKER